MTADTEIPAHLQAKQYDIRCQCLLCNRPYTKRVSEKAYFAIIRNEKSDPPCPRKACKEKLRDAEVRRMAERMAAVIAEGKAPGHTGSNFARAADYTANVVMKDYGMTNLRDDNRPDESSAPKLAPHLQAQADAYFGAATKFANPMLKARLQQATMIAQSGALAPQAATAIDRVLGSKYRPPVHIVNKGG